VVKIYFLKKGVSSGRRRLPATRRSAAKFGACPVAPPAATTVYARTLHRTCEILGGVPQLADHLRVPARLLRRWLDGTPHLASSSPPMAATVYSRTLRDEAAPQTGIFLKAVDYLLDETVPPQGGSEPGEPPPSQELSPGDDSLTAY